MPNVNEMFPGKYLKAADLQGREITVMINAVEEEVIREGESPKFVLYFKGKNKGMILNKTNANTIAYLYGPETDGWIGEQVTLFESTVDFKGTSTPALRVKPPTRKTKPMEKQKPRPTPQPKQIQEALDEGNGEDEGSDIGAEIDDEIPGDW